MATHYNPYCNNENEIERYVCGTIGHMDETCETNDKRFVTCKKCIKMFNKIDKWRDETEAHILKDMAGFVEFMEKENKQAALTSPPSITT